MTKPIAKMTQEELIWAIEGYAQSARRTHDRGGDPSETLSRVKSMIERYPNAPAGTRNGAETQQSVGPPPGS